MRRPGFQFRVGTLVLLTALAGLAMGYVRTWQRAPTRPDGPGYRIAATVLARRDARPSPTVRRGVDPITIGGAAVVWLAARRHRTRRIGRPPIRPMSAGAGAP